jgi:hypothetical protein
MEYTLDLREHTPLALPFSTQERIGKHAKGILAGAAKSLKGL